ncbi:myosin-10-like [Poecile atricapillus]|uniref:myosin-10-like n=1 Tax=Poecile atricapillus TaxID=48891 RepID=UPI0027385F3D|nr:myosin-10-like [Poecile atricapillus]
METPLDTLSLSQLLDLSIGVPEKGAIQFAAMRKLLQVMLEHLDVQYLTTEEPWPGQLSGPSLADVAAEVKEIKKEMEIDKKHTSEVLEDADGITSASKGLTKSSRSENLKKKKKGQSGTTKEKKTQGAQDEDVPLSLDLREEVQRIKTAQTHMAQTMKELAASMKKLEEDIKKLRQDTAQWREETSEELSQQIEAVLQETKRELQKMEEQEEMRSAMLEQLLTVTQLAGTEETVGSMEEEQKAKGECPSCSVDISEQLGELLLRCEKLQEQVDSLESRQVAMGKLERMMRNWGQDQEMMQPKDATVVQMQRDYEKLSFISESLQKDSQQKQQAIEKADKAALGSKVNCSQFDANMERLDERMQELQSQISGQEEHWNKMQQQFSDAMEEKLDRLELKAFSSQMGEMWRRSIDHLKSLTKEGDSGAGIRKQLPVPFSCLSCDRMLTMHVPGQNPETLPYLQPLPPSKEPQYSQRAHGSPPRVRHCCGDHHSSTSATQHIKASPQISAQPPRLLNRPRVNQLLDSSGHTWRGRSDQLPAVIRTLHESGPATSREHRPGTDPRHISWARGLLQPLQPRQTSTAPIQVDMTHRPVLDLAHLVRTPSLLLWLCHQGEQIAARGQALRPLPREAGTALQSPHCLRPHGLGSQGQIPMVPGRHCWRCWARLPAEILTGSPDADSGAACSHVRALAPALSPQRPQGLALGHDLLILVAEPQEQGRS